jgi:hypothetical protein
MARKPVPPCVGEGMVARRVVMRSRDVVFFKGVIEASEGLAAVYAVRGGDLTVAAPVGRAAELDALLDVLCEELGAVKASDGVAVPGAAD